MHKFLATAALLVAATGAHAAPLQLRFIGLQTVASDATFQDTRIGGLSGIDYDAATDRYTVISDDRSQFAPARFYEFGLTYTSQSFTGVTPLSTTVIRRPDGSAFPTLGVDPEAIRRTPSGTLVWANEGDATTLQNPTVREMNPDGSYVRDFAVPAKYNPTANNSSGIRNNLAFESLTYSPDGTKLFAATEGALNQDGPAASLGNGTAVRILQFDAVTGLPQSEFAYLVDAVAQAPVPAGQFVVSGLTELLALSSTQFLAVERSFSVGAGNTIKIYQLDLTGATDVFGVPSLAGQSFTPVTKTLIANLDNLGFAIDNVEGITFGRTLENGRRSLVLVADNNFGAGLSSQFLTFEVAAVPEPGTWALMLIGFGLSGAVLRRRDRALAS